MSDAVVQFSEDQAEAWDRVAAVLAAAGVNLADGQCLPAQGEARATLAIMGKAGSGKTMLLADLTRALLEMGVELVSGEYEGRRKRERRSLAVLAPTNKAASVLRGRGVAATTIHRILYTPVYDPEYERIAEWLTGALPRPTVEGLSDTHLTAHMPFMRRSNPFPGLWLPQVCAGRISLPAGSGAKTRWISALSMKARCWMRASWKICRNCSQP
jgi:exodeoxyribonuclease V